MRKGFVAIIFIICIGLIGCSAEIESSGELDKLYKIDLDKESESILSVAEELIIVDFDAERGGMTRNLKEESIKVHEIMELDGEVYLLYSYSYNIVDVKDVSEEEAKVIKSQEHYWIYLRRVEKNEDFALGYKLMGGGGSGGTDKNSPITMVGVRNKVYGLINSPKVAKIVATYDDGYVRVEMIDDEDYYFIHRDGEEDIGLPKVKAYDKDGNLVE